MNKTVKITAIVVVIATVIYLAYKYFIKKPAASLTTVPGSTGNTKSVAIAAGGSPVLVDNKSGGLNVGHLFNGTNPDPGPGAAPPVYNNSAPITPGVTADGGPVMIHQATGTPAVTDLANGLAPDVAPLPNPAPVKP